MSRREINGISNKDKNRPKKIKIYYHKCPACGLEIQPPEA